MKKRDEEVEKEDEKREEDWIEMRVEKEVFKCKGEEWIDKYVVNEILERMKKKERFVMEW